MAGLSIQSITAIAPRSLTPARLGLPLAQSVRSEAANPQQANSGVSVSFSAEALAASREPDANNANLSGELTEEEQAEVLELKSRDREVRQHEQAHVAAGGQYVQGGPQYEFTTGPDGRRYATGGEVNISASPERTPEETIRKARIIRRAALAPAEPSAQDRSVAAQAAQLESQARREIAESKAEERA